MPDIYKPITLKPLNGVLDVRSMPEDTAAGYVRHRENFQINAAGKMGRRQCWQKFLSKSSGYNNEDLHDQMLPAQIFYADANPVASGADDVRDYPPGNLCATVRGTRTQLREHPTLLFQAISTSGGRYWIVGTQSRLYELNVATGAYRLLADGLGGMTSDTLAVRFRVGQVKDTMVFTNNVDQPFSYTLGDEVSGCAMRATRSIPDLDLIKLSAAVDVIGFKGHILFFGVVMDGGRLQHRYVWSDFMLGAGSLKELVPGSATATANANDPRSYRASVSFDPAITDTIAGYDELPFGHKILRAIEFNRRILVFTNRGIFAVDTTGAADKAFGYVELYKHPDGAGCLVYPNTLVNCGDCLRYQGRDAIYRWDSFTIEPEIEEWLHLGTGEMFANLNTEACETHCAGYGLKISDGKEQRCLLLSYAEQGYDVPNRTLCVWPDQRFVSPSDEGMTSYGNCQPDSRPSINDFLRQYCVCAGSDISQQYLKEGIPVSDPACGDPVTSICHSEVVTPFTYDEDYNEEGSASISGFTVGHTYKVTFGASDISFVNRTTFDDPDTEIITENGFFVARATIMVGVTGTPSTPVTLVFEEVLTASGIALEGTDLFTEQFDLPCDDNSLCARLGDLKLDDICLGCESETVFVGASSRDKCLKQLGTAYSREICLNAEVSNGALNGFAYQNFRGTYSFEGYYSRIVIGPHPLGNKDVEKNVRNLMLELEHVPELVKNVIALRVGYSYSPLDPNKSACGVVWGPYRRLELSCPQSLTPAEYRAGNKRPHKGKEWSVFVEGRFLYFELTIAGLRNPNDLKSDLVPCLGGESYFSSVVVEARKA